MNEDELENALRWYREHENHVQGLIGVLTSYSPSEEDIGRPELWKPAHWRWFKDNFIEQYLRGW